MPAEIDLDALDRWARAHVLDGGDYARHASFVITHVPALIARVRALESEVAEMTGSAESTNVLLADLSPTIAPRLGDVGIRDPESPCDVYEPGETRPGAACASDGHYLCPTCRHYRPDLRDGGGR